MTFESSGGPTVWRLIPRAWAVVVTIVVLIVAMFYDALRHMIAIWSHNDEYGYGYLIPFISAFLIWQKKDELERMELRGSWAGPALLLIGIGMYFVGEFSAVNIIKQYAFVVTLAGVVLAFLGMKGAKSIWAPLVLLLFMIPLPYFLFSELSTRLQLISSELGVAVIRLFGISVYLEGNVIDLGSYKLQVVEACSGLRYLFPLTTLSFIAAYLFKGALWKRAVIFLSSIPITVAMNSVRIGIIGVMVEYGGVSMAEGFLHYFEGWVIFMVCMAILVGEMWALSRFGPGRRPFVQVFSVDLPAPTPSEAQVKYCALPSPLWASALLLCAAMIPAYLYDEPAEVLPNRVDLTNFPMTLGTWHGSAYRMDPIFLGELKPYDYLLADFMNGEREGVNLYIGYHAFQLKVSSPHSPRACLPGGGWQMKSLGQKVLDNVMIDGEPLKINRVVIQRGNEKQLVYYWFQQRGRYFTNEYAVKWFLFWDALTRNRTDGALIRLTSLVTGKDALGDADRRLTAFAKEISGRLSDYIPD